MCVTFLSSQQTRKLPKLARRGSCVGGVLIADSIFPIPVTGGDGLTTATLNAPEKNMKRSSRNPYPNAFLEPGSLIFSKDARPPATTKMERDLYVL